MELQKTNPGENQPTKNTLTVVRCGGNQYPMENAQGMTVAQVRRRFAELLNITAAHTTVVVNGRQVADENSQVVRGGEEVEFIKPSGQKG